MTIYLFSWRLLENKKSSTRVENKSLISVVFTLKLSHMSLSIPSSKIIILRIIRKSDGKKMSMNISESENRKVEFIKSQLKNLFHPHGKFHLYYKGRHIKSRHKLCYYGITSKESNIEIILD